MPKTWLPLDAVNKRSLCEEILRQLEVAGDPRRAAWAIKLINECLWFWTVDGQDTDCAVGRDRLKYDVDLLWHSERTCGLTREACGQRQPPAFQLPKKRLRHEHVVPRRVIVARLQSPPRPDLAGIHDLLERRCLGVVLTKEEDAGLNAVFRRSMPSGWQIDDASADSFARYKHQDVGLFERLHPPRGRAPGQIPHAKRRRSSVGGPQLTGTLPALTLGSLDPCDSAVTLDAITDLKARYALTNAQFRRLHHGRSPSLANHIAYYKERARIESTTNALVCLRLLECRQLLDQGGSWDEAIAKTLEKYPLRSP